MKKIVFLIAMLCMMLTGTALAGNPDRKSETVTVTLQVSYKFNKIGTHYDADVYMDGSMIATISQGKTETITIPDVSAGKNHLIEFFDCNDRGKAEKKHDKDTNTIRFVPDGDTVIRCTVNGHWYGVIIAEHTISGPDSSAPTYGTSTVLFDIAYEKDAFTVKDIDMYVDGTKITTLTMGKRSLIEVSMRTGTHTITFCRADAHSISESVTISVAGDSDFSCRLKYHSIRQFIEVTDIVTTAALR